MKNLLAISAFFILCSGFTSDNKFNKIYIVASDGVKISADLHFLDNEKPFVLLCHQAKSSRAEYRETARIFMDMGYNCLAVDLRSGHTFDDVFNETHRDAIAKGKGTEYLDAKQDIVDALDYIQSTYSQKSILLGSSYSASLALMIGKDNDNVKAILAFSPGEYFKKQKVIVAQSMKGLDKPTFITGSQSELSELEVLFHHISSDNKTMFIPEDVGAHGSKALRGETANNAEYWRALNEFLKSI